MSTPVRTEAVYTFDGSLEGLLSVVFSAYAEHVMPRDISCRQSAQGDLLCETRDVEVDLAHARRVRSAIRSRFSDDTYEHIEIAFLSDEPSRHMIIYRYIRHLFDASSPGRGDLCDDDIAAFERLWKSVYNERHRILQFLRFSRMEGDVYFARVAPKANVVPLVMEHFSARFNTQPFLIYDERHHVAGVYDLSSWYLVSTDRITVPECVPDEPAYRRLWKTFYDHICNERRYNPRLRAQLVPKRLWGNMTEMDPLCGGSISGRKLCVDPYRGSVGAQVGVGDLALEGAIDDEVIEQHEGQTDAGDDEHRGQSRI